MKIKIIADTSIKGVPAYGGDIIDVDEADGRILISYKLAATYIETPPSLPRIDNQEEIAIETVSSKTKKRR